MALNGYTIDWSEHEVDDLRSRVRASRFVTASSNDPWGGGVDPDYLGRLADYWADGFDFAAVSADLARYPHFTSDDPAGILHFVHTRAAVETRRLPVVLLHGWPSSFAEMLALADRLVDPVRFGCDPDSARDVVIPSLPGFFVSALDFEPLTRQLMANRIDHLMTIELGSPRYVAFGGDIGGTVAAWLGAAHADSVAAIHLIHPPFPASFDDPPLTAAEEAFLSADEA